MTTLDLVEILVRIAWLLGAVAFVIGLGRMNSPATARNGNLVSAGGMTIAIVATAVLILVRQTSGDGFVAIPWLIIIAGIALGGGLGLYTARTVKMTAIPTRIARVKTVSCVSRSLSSAAVMPGLRRGSRVSRAPPEPPRGERRPARDRAAS